MTDAHWPRLQLAGREETRATLHMCTQIVGKTRLALAPPQNHWWHAALYVSARGLTTSAIPWRDGALEFEFDLVRHVLEIRSSLGQTASIALASRPVAHFFRDYLAALEAFEIRLRLLWRPVEVRESIPFEQDTKHRTYDPEWANSFWRAMVQIRNVFEQFRGEFMGKASPVHFFWGAFDLAASRFSGRRAPAHPGGAPNVADWVMREAYSHEVSSAGFWTGDETSPEAVIYAYAYPEPQGFAAARVDPPEARWDAAFREFVLPYERLRLLPAHDLLGGGDPGQLGPQRPGALVRRPGVNHPSDRGGTDARSLHAHRGGSAPPAPGAPLRPRLQGMPRDRLGLGPPAAVPRPAATSVAATTPRIVTRPSILARRSTR
jgi:hypothetical protein